MLYFIIYMMQVIPTIRELTHTLTVLSFFGTLSLSFLYFVNISEPYAPKIMKYVKILSITCCVLSLLTLLIPNKTTLYQMSAIYLGKQINKSVHVDDKIQKISTVIDLNLDNTIKDLINEAKEQ